MAYRFKPNDRNIARAFSRIARDRLDHATAALDGAEPLEEALHTARKDIKKLRALYKLLRPAFPDYRKENRSLRDSARRVSALRDGTAMIECYDRLLIGRNRAETAAFAPWRLALEAEATPPDFAPRVAELRAALVAARARSKHWALKANGFDALAPGLEEGYRAARAAMKQAAKTGTHETFHEFRKRVKVHWYQAMLLAPIARDLMAPHVALAGELGERLGDLHDLVAFAARLPGAPLAPDARAALSAIVAEERRRIDARTFVLGGRLMADKPKALTRRWRAWWKLRAA